MLPKLMEDNGLQSGGEIQFKFTVLMLLSAAIINHVFWSDR